MENNEIQLSQLLQVRRDKLSELQSEGRDPFEITKYNRTHTSKEISEGYKTEERTVLVRGEETKVTAKISPLDGEKVTVAGRIMSKRGMGKVGFVHIADIAFSTHNSKKRKQLSTRRWIPGAYCYHYLVISIPTV